MKDDSYSVSLLTRIDAFKVKQTPFILYFETPDCGVCYAVFPKLLNILKDYDIVVVEVDAVENPEITGQHVVFTVPTVILWAAGKEMLRESRFIDFSKIIRTLDFMKMADSL